MADGKTQTSTPNADAIAALITVYGPAASSGLGSAVFLQATVSAELLEAAALARYRNFVGASWETREADWGPAFASSTGARRATPIEIGCLDRAISHHPQSRLAHPFGSFADPFSKPPEGARQQPRTQESDQTIGDFTAARVVRRPRLRRGQLAQIHRNPGLDRRRSHRRTSP